MQLVITGKLRFLIPQIPVSKTLRYTCKLKKPRHAGTFLLLLRFSNVAL